MITILVMIFIAGAVKGTRYRKTQVEITKTTLTALIDSSACWMNSFALKFFIKLSQWDTKYILAPARVVFLE